MNVSDVMIRQMDHLRMDDKLDRIASSLFAINVDCIPVLDGKKVVGILTREMLFKHLFPPNKSTNKQSAVTNTKMNIEINDIMDKKPSIIYPDTTLTQAHKIMSEYDVERFPVVDGSKRLIGTITKVDVFRAIIGQDMLFPENEEFGDFLSGTYFSSIDWDNRFKNEMPDLVRVLKKNNVKTILDIGCGTGNYSIELANRGFSVVGIDRSSSMINEANLRASKLRRKSLGNVSFWNKEAEDFLYDFDNKFDAILFMSNTLSHNPNNYRHIIKRAANSLSDRGVLIFQITNFDKALNAKNRLMNFYMTKPADQKIREYAFLEFLDKPILGKTILKNFVVLISENNTWQWPGIRSILMAYTDEDRIKSVLANEGFGEIETFGGSYDGKHWDSLFKKKFDPQNSDWLNVIASNKRNS